ncbi:MAG TPA: sugar phosphate isomerase/epimerase [Phycisphaerae bacterium]|nr:sugar phosphate isomerase/epimerase [Phycisphaerae bacterium]
MQFSAFTDILDRPFESALDALAGLGLRCIDLRSKIGQDNVDTLRGQAARRAAEAIASRNLRVGCVASWGVNPMSGDYDPAEPLYRQAMRERTAHLAQLAELLEAPSVRVYSLKRPDDPVTEQHRADNAAFLYELAAICAERKRLLVIENEPPTLTATCAELGDLMRRPVHESLKINWDIVNGWRAGELPWAPRVFDQIAGHVAHIHVKGARAAPDGSFATMAVPGKDDVPHVELLAALDRSGFDGTVTIDPHYGQFAEADKLTDVEEPVLEVVRQTLDYLRSIT